MVWINKTELNKMKRVIAKVKSLEQYLATQLEKRVERLEKVEIALLEHLKLEVKETEWVGYPEGDFNQGAQGYMAIDSLIRKTNYHIEEQRKIRRSKK